MAQESTNYELLVKDLLASKLAVSLATGDLTLAHNAYYIGKSGHNHQIDVSAEFRLAGLKFLILVECKYYDHSVGIDEVMEFATRIDDIGAHKGIIVTTKGFQSGALKMAKSKGIALVLAVDLLWTTCLESPSREVYLKASFARKLRAFGYEQLGQIETELYYFSAEHNRCVAREFGAIAKYQSIGEMQGRITIPTRGICGYVIAHDDFSVMRIILGYSLDDNPFLCFSNSGLMSFISVQCAT